MKYRKCENGSGPQSGGKRRSSASAPSAPNQEPSENDVEIRTKERRQVYSSSGEEKDAQSSMEDVRSNFLRIFKFISIRILISHHRHHLHFLFCSTKIHQRVPFP